MKKKDAFSRYASVVIASLAVATSLVAQLSLVEINRELLLSAGAAILGAGAAGLYVWAALRLRERIRERNRPRVFISYCDQDADFVLRLQSALIEHGTVPIVDRLELRVGDDIRKAVEELIETADYFIHVASACSAESASSKVELEYAQNHSKRILPIIIEGGALPESLDGVFYADFRESFESGVAALDRSLPKKRRSSTESADAA